jgi:hypothetical protein
LTAGQDDGAREQHERAGVVDADPMSGVTAFSSR